MVPFGPLSFQWHLQLLMVRINTKNLGNGRITSIFLRSPAIITVLLWRLGVSTRSVHYTTPSRDAEHTSQAAEYRRPIIKLSESSADDARCHRAGR